MFVKENIYRQVTPTKIVQYPFSSKSSLSLPRNCCLNLFSILLIPCLLLTGCSESFEPWQENDRYYFSIYGYLDATADTQWVRVMPVREDFFLKPEPIDATVTLEHIESGETVALNDSLFEYSHNAFAYNYWTTIDLQPGHRYKLTAERSDGLYSRAAVTLPEDFPVPTVSIDPRSTTDPTPVRTTVLIEGVEQLADVKTVYRSSDNREMITISHLQDSSRLSSGDLQVIMDPQEDFPLLDSFFSLPPGVNTVNFLDTPDIKQHIFIASAGPDYLFFPSIDQKIIALPEGASNIVDGVGYLAGIVSKTIPYKGCYKDESTIQISCDPVPPPWSKMPVRDLYLYE